MTKDEIIEVMALYIYGHWIFAPQVPWVAGGNSVKQGDAIGEQAQQVVVTPCRMKQKPRNQLRRGAS